jgi:hypothetical protein
VGRDHPSEYKGYHRVSQQDADAQKKKRTCERKIHVRLHAQSEMRWVGDINCTGAHQQGNKVKPSNYEAIIWGANV